MRIFILLLGKYVREENLMLLETAVYKMIGSTAERLEIGNSGVIARGYFADLVLFDPALVKDNETIKTPIALSTVLNMCG